jgi:hypothetical protein
MYSPPEITFVSREELGIGGESEDDEVTMIKP